MNGVVLYVPVFSQYFLLALTGDANMWLCELVSNDYCLLSFIILTKKEFCEVLLFFPTEAWFWKKQLSYCAFENDGVVYNHDENIMLLIFQSSLAWIILPHWTWQADLQFSWNFEDGRTIATWPLKSLSIHELAKGKLTFWWSILLLDIIIRMWKW